MVRQNIGSRTYKGVDSCRSSISRIPCIIFHVPFNIYYGLIYKLQLKSSHDVLLMMRKSAAIHSKLKSIYHKLTFKIWQHILEWSSKTKLHKHRLLIATETSYQNTLTINLCCFLIIRWLHARRIIVCSVTFNIWFWTWWLLEIQVTLIYTEKLSLPVTSSLKLNSQTKMTYWADWTSKEVNTATAEWQGSWCKTWALHHIAVLCYRRTLLGTFLSWFLNHVHSRNGSTDFHALWLKWRGLLQYVLTIGFIH